MAKATDGVLPYGGPTEMNIPVLIPTFNNPTHLRNMLAQLRALRLNDIRVIDNASTYPPMVDLLGSLEGEYRVIRRAENLGPRKITSTEVGMLPRFFCVTDPDLEFNPKLPADFVAQLTNIAVKHRVAKAG